MTALKVAQNSVSIMLSVYNLFTWSFHQQVNMSKLRYVNRIVKNFENCPLSSIQNFRFLLQHWRPLLFSIICRCYLVYVLLLYRNEFVTVWGRDGVNIKQGFAYELTSIPF